MVRVTEHDVDVCCYNIAPANVPTVVPCGLKATHWTVSWDVTGTITTVSATCVNHGSIITKDQVRKWGTHEVSYDVASALARR